LTGGALQQERANILHSTLVVLDWYRSLPAQKQKAVRSAFSAPLYDAVLDSAYIYGSFLSQYGIDLSCTRLHWWKFRTLLACLDDDSKFSRIVAYRGADTHSITDPAKRQFIEKMKRLYSIPDPRTDEEREMELSQCLEGLF